MPRKGSKVVDHEPKTYSLRLYWPEDRDYIHTLDTWLDERSPEVSMGQELRRIIKVMIDQYSGSNPAQSPIERDLNEIKSMLGRILAKPDLAARVATISRQMQDDDEAIDDDLIDNILEDMSR